MLPVNPAIDLCDTGHQAIAFVGTCPLCRVQMRNPNHGARPLAEGAGTFVSELDDVLREHYKP